MREPRALLLFLLISMTLGSLVRGALRPTPTSPPPAFLLPTSLKASTTTSPRRFLTVVGGASSDATATMTKKVLVPVADGSEEIESVTIIDTLVRGGAQVTVASVGPNLQVTCSRGVKLVADRLITDCLNEDWDAIACPGGLPGANHLRDSQPLTELLTKQNAAGRWVAAICASPAVVLHTHGLLAGRQATCYPAGTFTGALEKYTDSSPVVVDKNIVTSAGPGTSALFALKLVEVLVSKDKAQEVANGMLVPYTV